MIKRGQLFVSLFIYAKNNYKKMFKDMHKWL